MEARFHRADADQDQDFIVETVPVRGSGIGPRAREGLCRAFSTSA